MMFAVSAVSAESAETKVPVGWRLIPTGRTSGDAFRLIFLSSDKRNANPADIGPYNTFIQNLAAAGHTAIRPYSEGFRVVGCTKDTDARNNARTNPYNYTGVRIYWLNGVKVADNYYDFHDGTWDNENKTKNEKGGNGFGIRKKQNYPLTGCKNDGKEAFYNSVRRSLGRDNIRVARPHSSTGGNGPLSSHTFTVTRFTKRPMYGLSEVFRVAPPNTPAAGAPVVRGRAELGRTLSARVTMAGLLDVNGRSMADAGDAGYAYTYQWQYVDADGVSNPEDIAGATENTYTVTLADADRRLRAGVSFRDDDGYDEGPLFSSVLPSGGTVSCEGDVVWCAVLTVKSLSTGLGCKNSSGSHKCSNSARLSDDDFTYAMTDYTITGLFVQSDGTLWLDLDDTIAAGNRPLILHVDDDSFAFTEADTIGGAHRRAWDDSGLDWSINDRVEVKLSVDTTRPRFSACSRR